MASFKTRKIAGNSQNVSGVGNSSAHLTWQQAINRERKHFTTSLKKGIDMGMVSEIPYEQVADNTQKDKYNDPLFQMLLKESKSKFPAKNLLGYGVYSDVASENIRNSHSVSRLPNDRFGSPFGLYPAKVEDQGFNLQEYKKSYPFEQPVRSCIRTYAHDVKKPYMKSSIDLSHPSYDKIPLQGGIGQIYSPKRIKQLIHTFKPNSISDRDHLKYILHQPLPDRHQLNYLPKIETSSLSPAPRSNFVNPISEPSELHRDNSEERGIQVTPKQIQKISKKMTQKALDEEKKQIYEAFKELRKSPAMKESKNKKYHYPDLSDPNLLNKIMKIARKNPKQAKAEYLKYQEKKKAKTLSEAQGKQQKERTGGIKYTIKHGKK